MSFLVVILLVACAPSFTDLYPLPHGAVRGPLWSLTLYLQPSQFLGRMGIQQRLAWWPAVKKYRSQHTFALKTNNKFNAWPFSGSFGNLGREIDLLVVCFVFRMWVIWCSQGNSLFVFLKVIRTYAREYNEIWKTQFGLDPIQTYPDIFESTTFSFRIQKCPRPHVSVFKSPIHTYPDSL